MDSLVTYKQLLLKKHLPTKSQERLDVSNQCLTLLGQLEEIDPMRRQRYQDMGTCYVLSVDVWVYPNLIGVYRRSIKGMMFNHS
jgi:hypothetical protein